MKDSMRLNLQPRERLLTKQQMAVEPICPTWAYQKGGNRG